MTKRILAPIDGRERSEAIVPVVAALAQENGATVRLLRIFPIPEAVIGTHGRTVAYSDQEMARLTGEALDELAHVEAALDRVPVETVVRFGDPVEEIVREAEAFDADLIALVASPRDRVREALAPGVAARVARKAPVPTLVLQEAVR